MRQLSVVPLLLAVTATTHAQSPVARPTGHTINGLPALNFDADEGFGYGAILQYYDYGSARVEPYRFSLQPTLFLTTRGRRDATLFLDAPHLLPNGWRLGASCAALTARWLTYRCR